MASPLWLGITYFIGNVMWWPGAIWGNGVSGALPTSMADGMLNWWYAHNLFGLWLTPMLLAGLYYLVPRIIKKPPGNCRLSAAEEWRNGSQSRRPLSIESRLLCVRLRKVSFRSTLVLYEGTIPALPVDPVTMYLEN